MLNQWNWIGSVLVLGAAVALLSGCGTNPKPAVDTNTTKTAHEGWWCAEHGVPEGICAQCSTKLAAEYQKKGDWCKEHKRPESQCFICHPDLEAKFAKQYETREGKKPPKPETKEG